MPATSTSPVVGQPFAGNKDSPGRFSSGVSLTNVRTRAAAPRDVSILVQAMTIPYRLPLKLIKPIMASPMAPPPEISEYDMLKLT